MRLSVKSLDWFLVMPFIAGVIMISEFDSARPDALDISIWLKVRVLLSATVIAAIGVAAASAIDRRCSEEYVFQILANAALIAFASTMLVNLVWVIGEAAFDLPELASDNIVGVTTISWVLGYYWFRLKGIAQ